MALITEIAQDVYRISSYFPDFDLQFNQFLIKDDEPLLYETGMKQIFPLVREAVAKIIDPSTIRWIGFSHYEPDECGSLNEWLQIAPNAETVCSQVGANVFVNDSASRPAKGFQDDEVFQTGTHRFRFQWTPHLPHGWDAGMLFDEKTRTLLCSDLLHQNGNVEPSTDTDVIERCRQALITSESGPFSNYLPFTAKTEKQLQKLGALQPRVCATMHGSAFVGDGQRALADYGGVLKEIFGKQ